MTVEDAGEDLAVEETEVRFSSSQSQQTGLARRSEGVRQSRRIMGVCRMFGEMERV